jgi:hypothetical protein
VTYGVASVLGVGVESSAFLGDGATRGDDEGAQESEEEGNGLHGRQYR